jgi:pentachlorophenol monooxygenase/3-(3-hydroxy-phenyl)propionate hydroxylase
VWSSVYRFQSRLVDRMRVGRVLLAGDVAHLVSPFGARGLNSGVADAENAAWKLAFVLAGWAGEDLLESYHVERHAAAVENLDVTTATMRFLVPGTAADRQLRLSTLSSAAVDPTARARVDSGRLAEPFWYVDSPLTTPNPSRPFAGRPPRGTVSPPGPGLLTPDVPITIDGRVSRLRAVARDGFLLLAADDVDIDDVRAAAHRATGAPVRALRMSDIDPTGGVTEAFAAKPTELWLLRPDAHVAALLTQPRPTDITAAIRRAMGLRY